MERRRPIPLRLPRRGSFAPQECQKTRRPLLTLLRRVKERRCADGAISSQSRKFRSSVPRVGGSLKQECTVGPEPSPYLDGMSKCGRRMTSSHSQYMSPLGTPTENGHNSFDGTENTGEYYGNLQWSLMEHYKRICNSPPRAAKPPISSAGKGPRRRMKLGAQTTKHGKAGPGGDNPRRMRRSADAGKADALRKCNPISTGGGQRALLMRIHVRLGQLDMWHMRMSAVGEGLCCK